MIVDLHNAVAAVCPIHGVSIGSESDPSTWTIDFRDDASPAQRAAAAQVLAAFDPLSSEKAAAKARIDVAAEMYRSRYITPGSGMAMTYLEKHAQARAVLDMGQVAADSLDADARKAQFPTLAASVGREAPTLFACAELVVAAYGRFADLSNVIETARLDAKAAVAAAESSAGVRAAEDAIRWP